MVHSLVTHVWQKTNQQFSLPHPPTLRLPKMCQNSLFPSRSSWRRRNFLGKHLRSLAPAAKAGLLCSIYQILLLASHPVQGPLKRHTTFPGTVAHPLVFLTKGRKLRPLFKPLFTDFGVGGYVLLANSFLSLRRRQGNGAVTGKISMLGTKSLESHFSLILLRDLFTTSPIWAFPEHHAPVAKLPLFLKYKKLE